MYRGLEKFERKCILLAIYQYFFMADLFSKSIRKQTAQLFQGFDLSKEIVIVQELFEDYKK
jgi:hypothetical protein